MRRLGFYIVLFLLLGCAYNAVCQSFVVYDTIPIRHGTSKLRLYRNIEKWFEKEKGQKLIAKNWKELKFKGKGYFPYANYVQIPDVYLSSHAAEKTKGSIIFNIDVSIQDSIIVTKFSGFTHEARFTEYGTMSFGRLMAYEKVPSGKCMEVEEWCNAVWKDMKDWSVYETKVRAKRMIPSTLVRKRSYKGDDDKDLVPPATHKEDSMEYLNLDNYLLKDTEGKYADYDKWPEDIEEERAAAAAAAAAKEKEKKKSKGEDEEDEDEDYEESDVSQEAAKQAETETVAANDDFSSKQKAKNADDEEDESYDDDEDDEDSVKSKKSGKKDKSSKADKSEKPAKSSKPEKTKKEKAPKKSKSNDDDDDDYDDYDD